MMTKKTTSLNPGLGQESPEGVLRNKTPSRAYELAKKYFFKSLSTIDIGSGAGTNTAWLNENGYESVGIESDNELRVKAGAISQSKIYFRWSSPLEISR